MENRLAETLVRYLDCPCRFFERMKDDSPIMAAFDEAASRGKTEGFTPMLIPVDDMLVRTIVGCVTGNTDLGADPYAFDIEVVREWRKAMLSAPLPALEEILTRRRQELAEDLEISRYDFSAPPDRETVETVEEFQPANRLISCLDYSGRRTWPLVLAEIPVSEPWKVFVWVPFGGWNMCPDTDMLMVMSEEWYRRFGAVPAAVTHDVLEYLLPGPVQEEYTSALAQEHYLFCPDSLDCAGEAYSPAVLAAVLARSTVWSFWWD